MHPGEEVTTDTYATKFIDDAREKRKHAPGLADDEANLSKRPRNPSNPRVVKTLKNYNVLVDSDGDFGVCHQRDNHTTHHSPVIFNEDVIETNMHSSKTMRVVDMSDSFACVVFVAVQSQRTDDNNSKMYVLPADYMKESMSMRQKKIPVYSAFFREDGGRAVQLKRREQPIPVSAKICDGEVVVVEISGAVTVYDIITGNVAFTLSLASCALGLPWFSGANCSAVCVWCCNGQYGDRVYPVICDRNIKQMYYPTITEDVTCTWDGTFVPMNDALVTSSSWGVCGGTPTCITISMLKLGATGAPIPVITEYEPEHGVFISVRAMGPLFFLMTSAFSVLVVSGTGISSMATQPFVYLQCNPLGAEAKPNHATGERFGQRTQINLHQLSRGCFACAGITRERTWTEKGTGACRMTFYLQTPNGIFSLPFILTPEMFSEAQRNTADCPLSGPWTLFRRFVTSIGTRQSGDACCCKFRKNGTGEMMVRTAEGGISHIEYVWSEKGVGAGGDRGKWDVEDAMDAGSLNKCYDVPASYWTR